MSNFLKEGKRKAARQKKKETKHHTKEFYKIMGELDRVADILKEDEEFMKDLQPDDIWPAVSKISDIEQGNLELFILKGKLGLYESMEKDIENAKQS